MTISTTARRAGPYAGNSATVAFPFVFKIFSVNDLVVQTRIGTAAAVTLTPLLDYIVTINPNQDTAPGGLITCAVAPATGTSLLILSAVPETQPASLQNQGGMFPTVLNDAYDRCVALIQQITDRSLGFVRGQPGDTFTLLPAKADLANKFLAFDSSGNPTTSTGTGGGGGGGGSTNLSIANRGTETLDIASDTGTDATIPAATTSLTGLFTAADKTKLNGIGTGANVTSVAGRTGVVTLTSGDISGLGSLATLNAVGTSNITDTNVTNAKLSNVAASTFKGRVTASTGVPEDMTATQATSLLDLFTSSLKGLAPASGGGSTNFLRADGTWAVPAGGTGTNVSYTASTRAVASSTGSGFTFPLVTSTDAGLAPLSGGGTTNFLRADGTWAAPSGGTGTNITYTASTRAVASSTGSGFTFPLVTTTEAGLAPLSGGGTANFLRADASWASAVTSVGGTGTVSGLTLTGTVTGTGNLTLGGTLAVTAANFASQTANTFLAAPSGAAGVPTFRALVALDVPTLNQSTTGSAATLTTGRNFSISGGGITASAVSFNGSAAVTLSASVDAAHITLARMANLAANSFIGNNTGSAATPIAMTGTQATALLDTVTTSLKGLAPASGGGTTNFLRADGTWAAPSGGTGTNISYTASTRAVASSTGSGFTFPLLTSTEAGLAPLSGGGTTNFLRADGTWAAPSGGGGSATHFIPYSF